MLTRSFNRILYYILLVVEHGYCEGGGFGPLFLLYSGLHLNEKTAGKDARAPSRGYADYSYLRADENRCREAGF